MDNSLRSPARNFIYYTLMFMFVAAISYLLLEVGYARYYVANMHTVMDKEFDPLLGWNYVPGTYRIKTRNSFLGHDVYINELGLRNNEITKTPQGSKTRLLVLGDSFTFAKAVPIEESYTHQLGVILNASSKKKYEVINAGVEGYGTAQELLLLRRLVEKNNISSDIFVLQLFTNDILDNLGLSYGTLSRSFNRPGFILDQNGALTLNQLPRRKSYPKDNRKHVSTNRSMLLEVAKTNIESFLQSWPDAVRFAHALGIDVEFPRMPGVVNAWYNDEVVASGVPLTRELIKEIRKEVDSYAGKLIAVFIPASINIYPDLYGPLLMRTFPDNPQVKEWRNDIDKPARLIKRLCKDAGIPLLDMTQIFSMNTDKSLYIPRDSHLTRFGHKLVAEALAQFISELNNKRSDNEL